MQLGLEIVIPGLPVRAEPGIQTVIRGASWIPGQARNDGVGSFVIPPRITSFRGDDHAGIQYATRVKQPCVYVLASRRNGTLYVGVTSDLVQRVWQHKNDLVEGFTNKYGVHMLVWYEPHETMESAISREKTIKGWHRAWKLALIERANTAWRDLYGDIV